MAILNLQGRYFRFYPTGNPLGYTKENLKLDSTRTAFLLVDVYGPHFTKKSPAPAQA